MATTTSKSTTCKKCNAAITRGANCVGCEGLCKDFFHASCVKLSRDDLMQYQSISNVWWICIECREAIVKLRNNRTQITKQDEQVDHPDTIHLTRIDNEIVQLKEQIQLIHRSLSTPSTSCVDTSVESSNRNQTLTESSSLLCSSGNHSDASTNVGCRSSTVVQRSPNDRFWLFFTKIKNSVTEQQILKLIHDSLGTDDAVIKKLVPVWKDTFSMPYISFKVGINVRFKDTALLSSTWPTGLRFREFHDTIWEPL